MGIIATVDIGEVIDHLRSSDYRYLVPVVLMIFPQVALRSLRWQRLMAQQGIACPYRTALVFYFAAIYIGLVTPGRMGELGKCLFLKQNRIAGVAQSLPSVLVDRLLDLYILGLLALGALYHIDLLPITPLTAALLAATLAGLPWFLFKWFQTDERLNAFIDGWLSRFTPRWQEAWRAFVGGSRPLFSPRLAESVALTILSYTIYFAQVCLIGQSIELPLACGDIAMVTAIGILVGYVPITIAGLGTREATLIFLFGQFGISASSALSFAFLYNLVYIVCVGVISAVFWIRMPHRQALKSTLKDSH